MTLILVHLALVRNLGRHLGLVLVSGAIGFALDSLQRLAAKHPELPRYCLRALRYPESIPAVCEWTLL